MARNTEGKQITIKSILNGVLVYNGISIAPLDILSVNEELARELIATGYIAEVKTKSL